jgi:hypothetical protein
MALLAELWQGRRPLPETFWLWGVGVLFALNLVALGHERTIGASGADPLWYLLWLGNGAWRAFALVPIWRSARTFRGRLIWRSAARLAWLLVMVKWGLRFAARTGG